MIEDLQARRPGGAPSKTLCACACCGAGIRGGELLFKLPDGDIICERCLEEGNFSFHRCEAYEDEVLPVVAG